MIVCTGKMYSYIRRYLYLTLAHLSEISHTKNQRAAVCTFLVTSVLEQTLFHIHLMCCQVWSYIQHGVANLWRFQSWI